MKAIREREDSKRKGKKRRASMNGLSLISEKVKLLPIKQAPYDILGGTTKSR